MPSLIFVQWGSEGERPIGYSGRSHLEVHSRTSLCIRQISIWQFSWQACLLLGSYC